MCPLPLDVSSAALCGGTVKNATVGRVLSPTPHHGPLATLDRSCSWSLEAPKDQRLHLHLERLALGPTDRLDDYPLYTRHAQLLKMRPTYFNCTFMLNSRVVVVKLGILFEYTS